mmetsp:Transcript_9158/g.13290  ORF Transcript_9158/g.13290 Transcript_9158/m.13290 type:complete len:181 (+) Transcript_9158:202-744(+)|eukprot:CAMPEP_0195519032 /NCGR_PEP_ID=MMETSP0794_2-20130614/14231_1 /TAXON_ID=515487 /ORGANISM="Stephanopyxis turris, Strain CCMP 815" /LENGTH=180 /DNA_ID=CAMNT_0040648109 /DNA_START=193 /DNA_END=735 /DNA_ORIENTATION=-
MMLHQFLSPAFVLQSFLFISADSAFITSPNVALTHQRTHSRITPVFASSIGKNGGEDTTTAEPFASTEADSNSEEPDGIWSEQLESQEFTEVREELVNKYLELGRSLEYAEAEVTEFLSDRDRSEKFIEMRRYAKAQADYGMGLGPLISVFFIGLLGNVGAKYFFAYKEVYPDGGGPLGF